MGEEAPEWRKILLVIVFVISALQLISTCAGTDKRKQYEPDFNTVNNDLMMQQQEINARIINSRNTISNNILYTPYKDLDTLSVMQKDNYDIFKLEKDSLIYADLNTQIKIPKGFYVQNNHDDTLRMAFKSPADLNIFIHDFKAAKDFKENFSAIKRDKKLQHYKLENSIGSTKVVSYKITKEDKRFNGYAICFITNEYQMFFEFESQNIPKDQLKTKAIDFLLENFKQKK